MSSAFRHVSQGMAGDTGAPRPALVTAAGGVSAREQDITIAMNAATSATQTLRKARFSDIGADHRLGRRLRRDCGRGYRTRNAANCLGPAGAATTSSRYSPGGSELSVKSI